MIRRRGARAGTPGGALRTGRIQISSPGPSNTGAVTPTHEPNGSESQSSGSNTEPVSSRLAQCRIDKFNVAFAVELSHEQDLDLAGALHDAQKFECGLLYPVGETVYTLEPTGAAGRQFRLRNADGTILAGRDRQGYGVLVEFSAVCLATHTPGEVVDRAWKLASSIAGATAEKARLRRLDLCADALGVDFVADDVNSFVSRAKREASFHRERVHTKRTKSAHVCTGIWVGLGHEISARLYDKTEELRTQCADDHEKRLTEERAFRAAGWDGKSPVWRLELQLRGKAIDELGVRAPEEAIERLDSVWRYAFGSPGENSKQTYCRLVLPEANRRRERADTDPRWSVFQSADFGNTSKQPAERAEGSRGNARLTHVLGMLRSGLGARQRLRSFPDSTDPERVLDEDLKALRELVLGSPEVLQSHCEKRNAVIGRFASADDGTVVPNGRGLQVVDLWEGLDEMLTG